MAIQTSHVVYLSMQLPCQVFGQPANWAFPASCGSGIKDYGKHLPQTRQAFVQRQHRAKRKWHAFCIRNL
jgi:hypothetical protein